MLSFSETFKQGCSFHGNPSKATLVLRHRNPTLLWEITGRKGNVERLELLGKDPTFNGSRWCSTISLVSWTCEYDDTNLCSSTYTAKNTTLALLVYTPQAFWYLLIHPLTSLARGIIAQGLQNRNVEAKSRHRNKEVVVWRSLPLRVVPWLVFLVITEP